MWLMILSMALSLVSQYYVAQRFDIYSFNQGCGGSHSCRGAAMVYRISFCTTIVFAALAIITKIDPRIHDDHWGTKFTAFFLLLVASIFTPNDLFFGFVWVARLGAFVFVILQQVLLIDLAYYVNDTLVTEANAGTSYEFCGLATPLVALLVMSFALFSIAIAGVALLFVYFGTDCESPNVIMSLTVIGIVVATLCQLFSVDSNLLASSFVAVYCTYLAGSALAANPVANCNPFYSSSSDWLSIALGLGFTVLALGFTIFSASSNIKYLKDGRGDGTRAADNAPGGAMMNKILTGQLDTMDSNDGTPQINPENPPALDDDEPEPKTGAEVCSFNLVLVFMSMFVAMALTSWGATTRSGRATNPTSGKVAMWMQAASQWTCLLLYTWTCVAPILFPDRDFS